MDNSSELTIEAPDLSVFRGKKIAIIGTGGVASFAHIPAYKTLGLDVVALVDKSESGLKKAQRAIGLEGTCKQFQSIKAFVRDPLVQTLDMIDLALPSPLHEAALDFLLDELGRQCPNVLVQKPLTQSYDVTLRVLTKAKDQGCRLFVNLNGRFVPTFYKTQALIDQGAIGAVRSATVLNRGLNIKKPGEWRGALSQLILYEMAIHHLDFLLWTLGPVQSVQAVTQTAPRLGVTGEAFASVLLRFETDAVASIVEDWTCHAQSAWRYHPSAEEIVITGDSGTIHATPKTLNLTTEVTSQNWKTEADWFPDAFAGPMAEALSATQQVRPSMLDGMRSAEVQRVLEATYEAAASHQTVCLNNSVKTGRFSHA